MNRTRRTPGIVVMVLAECVLAFAATGQSAAPQSRPAAGAPTGDR
jgi:hypothetical protein